MPQSDGTNILRRFEFKIGSRSYKFKLNPEEYSQDEPSRSTVTQTKGGAWIDDFGGGLEVIFMRGSTGMKNGYSRFRELRDIIRYYKDNTTPGSSPAQELTFHNFTDGESWIVHLDPAGFKLFRSKSNPLMYMYEIRLVCLRPASQPEIEQKTEVIVDRDEFQLDAEMKQLEEAVGNGTAPKADANIGLTPRIPNRLADTATRGAAVGYEPINPNVQGRGYLQFFAERSHIYEGIKPSLDLRLSPLGMHYKTHIVNNTYRPSGEFEEGTLGYLVFNKIFNYSLWNDYGETFTTIMLDLYSITDAYFSNYELFKSRFSKADAERLIDNIRWIVMELEDEDAIVDMEMTPLIHEVTSVFRQVELTLSRMRKDPNLFDRDISKDLQQLEAARGDLNG